jgi:predicted acetyltransferase
MTKDAERPPPRIEVIPATSEQQPIVENLLELYAHDFSEFHNVELGPDGRFGYKNLPLYWLEANRYPFLVEIDSKLAGFVFVKKGSEISGNETVWDMAEFFVARGYRRQGAGTKIAHEIWKQFTGPWEVRVMESNHSAQNFWQHVIMQFTGETIHSVRIEKDGHHWHLFSFESNHPD